MDLSKKQDSPDPDCDDARVFSSCCLVEPAKCFRTVRDACRFPAQNPAARLLFQAL